MKAPIIVNESPTPLEPGCISIFSSVDLAERAFEAWYADESYFACDVDGVRLEMMPEKESGSIWIEERNEEPARPDIAKALLRAYVGWLISKRKVDDPAMSETWLQSASKEELAEVSLQFATE